MNNLLEYNSVLLEGQEVAVLEALESNLQWNGKLPVKGRGGFLHVQNHVTELHLKGMAEDEWGLPVNF